MDKTIPSSAFKVSTKERSLRDNIKKLKQQNKSQFEKKHKEYYKKYIKDIDADDKYNNTHYELLSTVGGFKSLEESMKERNISNLKSRTPIELRTMSRNSTGIQITTQNLETITGSNFYPNLNTSKGSLITPKNNNYQLSTYENFLTSASNTKTSFMKTNYTTSSHKSSLTKNIISPPKLTEDEAIQLISFYHINKYGAVENGLKKTMIKEDKIRLFDKFGIKKEVNEHDIEFIEKLIKNSDKKNDFQKKMDKFNKTEYGSTPYFFTDPFKAYKKLKMNGEIFKSIMNHRTSEQIELYKNIYKGQVEDYLKVRQMPTVREAKTNKGLEQLKVESNNKPTVKKRILETEETESEEKKEKEKEILLPNPINDTVISATQLKLSREQILEQIELYVSYEVFKNKPNARSQFTLNLDENELILFGGLNSERLFDIWFCNLKDYKWRTFELEEDDAPVPRSGHTAILYKKEIFIYGGATPREYYRPREEIVIFSLITRKFYYEKAYNRPEVGWRRNHVAKRVGNYMLVHGGIDESERFLSDCSILELSKMYWSKLESKYEKPTGIAYHCAELVVDNDKLNHPGFTIYKPPDIPINKNMVKKIKIEGVYFFGGMDENRNYSNELKILKVTKRPCEWIYPKIHGIPPIARAYATMNYYTDLNILIIHGGKNETERKTALNDIFVLDLEKLHWIRCSFHSNIPLDRTEHSSVIFGDKLLILGGNNGEAFNKFEFCVVHLDLQNKRSRHGTGVNDKQIQGSQGLDKSHLSVGQKFYMSRDTKQDDFFHKRRNSNLPNIIEGLNLNKDMASFLETDKLKDILKLISESGFGDILNEDQ